MLSPELAIGIRRVKGVKRLGRRIGNWLSGDQAQDLLNSIPQSTLRGRRDAAMIGLLLGCGLRRSEAKSDAIIRFIELESQDQRGSMTKGNLEEPEMIEKFSDAAHSNDMLHLGLHSADRGNAATGRRRPGLVDVWQDDSSLAGRFTMPSKAKCIRRHCTFEVYDGADPGGRGTGHFPQSTAPCGRPCSRTGHE
jgi:hypothetical protein